MITENYTMGRCTIQGEWDQWEIIQFQLQNLKGSDHVE